MAVAKPAKTTGAAVPKAFDIKSTGATVKAFTAALT